MSLIRTDRRLLLRGVATAPLAIATAATAQGSPCTAGAGIAPGRWIRLDELERSLPSEPIAVGFDVDDTLVFSSPAFNAVLNARDAAGANPYGSDRRAVVSNPRSWEDLHAIHDAYVLPKTIGVHLLALHRRRGDRIHLVTARVNVKGELLEQRLRKMFDVELAGPMQFSALKPKTELLRARAVRLYYGDSDSDIEAAQAAGARGIRVMRAANAIDYDKPPMNGRFGEDVLVDSDR